MLTFALTVLACLVALTIRDIINHYRALKAMEQINTIIMSMADDKSEDKDNDTIH